MASRDAARTGARIARRRHQLGWTQVQLAARIGVSSSTVANWERGASYPKKKLGKVEQILGVNLDEELPPAPKRTLSPQVLAEIREMCADEAEYRRVIAEIEETLRGRGSPGAAEASGQDPDDAA